MVTSPRSSTRTRSNRVAPRACATPPSTWPRHCSGFITRPASAPWTLRRIRISPLSGSTASRNHCELNATERGEPPQCPSPVSVTPCAAAAANTSLSGTGRPSHSTASAPSVIRLRGVRAYSAVKLRMRSASALAAFITALPATTVPAEPKAPVSWRTTSVSDCRTVIRSTVVPSAPAVICLCTVVVPLPNSAVPTAMS